MANTKYIPVLVRIAGLEIKAQAPQYPGHASWYRGVTIPKQWIPKLLASGKVRVRCTGVYTDDYAFDLGRNYGIGDARPEGFAADLERWGWSYTRARVTCEGRDNHPYGIHVYRHSNEGHDIIPLDGVIEVIER